MITKLISPGLLLMFIASTPVVAQDAGDLGWDEGRATIMKDSLYELHEYEPFKSWPDAERNLFATCVVEKRIQMGKKLGCGWSVEPGVTPQQHFEDQYKCFEDGGYGKAERIAHSNFCNALVKHYF